MTYPYRPRAITTLISGASVHYQSRLLRLLAAIALITAGFVAVAAPATAQCRDDCRGSQNPPSIPGGMGWGGGISGASIGGPARGAGWASSPSYGAPVASIPKVAARTMSAIERLANRYGVPWPKEGTIRARDMSTYRVYQIYAPAPRGGSRVYKYGITKRGAERPKRQRGACAKYFKVDDCQFSWVRKGVGGWKHARQVEAGYAAKYKNKFGGDCPPGMPRCL